jgi:hypothetical protein
MHLTLRTHPMQLGDLLGVLSTLLFEQFPKIFRDSLALYFYVVTSRCKSKMTDLIFRSQKQFQFA